MAILIPVQVQWGLMKQGVVLPHKFTANTLCCRIFHDHDVLFQGTYIWKEMWKLIFISNVYERNF